MEEDKKACIDKSSKKLNENNNKSPEIKKENDLMNKIIEQTKDMFFANFDENTKADIIKHCEHFDFRKFSFDAIKVIEEFLKQKRQENVKIEKSPSLLKYVKTDILEPYLTIRPNLTELYKQGERSAYLIKGDEGKTGILKIAEFKTSQEEINMKHLRREFYICRSFGKMCSDVAKVYDMKEIYIENGTKKRVEMLFEYGGVSLDKILPSSESNTILASLELDNRITIACRLACILEVMESAGLAHLDLKLQNITCDINTLKLKLIDFGAAISFYKSPEKVAEVIGEQIEKVHECTRAYAPPEILKYLNAKNNKRNELSKEIIAQKVDIFSFGIIFTELLLKKSIAQFNRALNGSLESHESFIKVINEEFEKQGLKCWLDVIIKCLDYKGVNRPTFEN